MDGKHEIENNVNSLDENKYIFNESMKNWTNDIQGSIDALYKASNYDTTDEKCSLLPNENIGNHITIFGLNKRNGNKDR